VTLVYLSGVVIIYLVAGVVVRGADVWTVENYTRDEVIKAVPWGLLMSPFWHPALNRTTQPGQPEGPDAAETSID
jgi:hypothetical protein